MTPWPPALKVCGLTRARDALAASQAGAAYLGVVLAPGKRMVAAEDAPRIFADLPARRAGVFVNASASELLRAARTAGLQVLQLHGDEAPELGLALRDAGYTVWKALRPRGGDELLRLAEPWGAAADALLLDGWSAAARGGTGTAFPWEAVAERLPELPAGPALVVAGGLNPGNVARAARLLRPAVVDVSSGVERAPGEKDPAALAAFVAALRGLAEEEPHRP